MSVTLNEGTSSQPNSDSEISSSESEKNNKEHLKKEHLKLVTKYLKIFEERDEYQCTKCEFPLDDKTLRMTECCDELYHLKCIEQLTKCEICSIKIDKFVFPKEIANKLTKIFSDNPGLRNLISSTETGVRGENEVEMDSFFDDDKQLNKDDDDSSSVDSFSDDDTSLMIDSDNSSSNDSSSDDDTISDDVTSLTIDSDGSSSVDSSSDDDTISDDDKQLKKDDDGSSSIDSSFDDDIDDIISDDDTSLTIDSDGSSSDDDAVTVCFQRCNSLKRFSWKVLKAQYKYVLPVAFCTATVASLICTGISIRCDEQSSEQSSSNCRLDFKDEICVPCLQIGGSIATGISMLITEYRSFKIIRANTYRNVPNWFNGIIQFLPCCWF